MSLTSKLALGVGAGVAGGLMLSKLVSYGARLARDAETLRINRAVDFRLNERDLEALGNSPFRRSDDFGFGDGFGGGLDQSGFGATDGGLDRSADSGSGDSGDTCNHTCGVCPHICRASEEAEPETTIFKSAVGVSVDGNGKLHFSDNFDDLPGFVQKTIRETAERDIAELRRTGGKTACDCGTEKPDANVGLSEYVQKVVSGVIKLFDDAKAAEGNETEKSSVATDKQETAGVTSATTTEVSDAPTNGSTAQ